MEGKALKNMWPWYIFSFFGLSNDIYAMFFAERIGDGKYKMYLLTGACEMDTPIISKKRVPICRSVIRERGTCLEVSDAKTVLKIFGRAVSCYMGRNKDIEEMVIGAKGHRYFKSSDMDTRKAGNALSSAIKSMANN